MEKNTIYIFDQINIIYFFHILYKKNKTLYLKENLFSRLLVFFNFKNIKKLHWNLHDLKFNNTKIITSVIENHEVDDFVYNFLNTVSLEKKLEINFYNYLVKYFSNNNHLISFMSVQNFLVFYKYCLLFETDQKKIIFLKNNIFQEFINKNYESNNINIRFYKNFLNIKLIKEYLSLIKKIKFIFNKKKKKTFNDKKFCVMDSFEINKPKFFFSEKNFYEQTLFINNHNNNFESNVINIYNYISFKIIIKTLCYFLNFKKNFKKKNLLNFLQINFFFEKQIYYDFFKLNSLKIFISSYVAQPFTSCAIAAIQNLEGKSIGFTISFSEGYSSHQNIDAFDYFISFNNCKYKFSQFSNLKKIEFLGYISDYKFIQKRDEAKTLRDSLKKNGAKYVIGFFDQGSSDDEMFQIGHNVSRLGYKFLLEKIIKDDNFALVIKPKKPKLLKKKLGNIYDLLIKAKETNRCIVFDNFAQNHVKNFEDIPAKIAMASDLTIHDTLLAGTAGLESALVGTKSIYFDYYNSTKNQFEEKGLNIVFRDWHLLWENLEKDFLKEPSNLGDWSQIIENFDDFRDGKANIRIMEFIKKTIIDKKNEKKIIN